MDENGRKFDVGAMELVGTFGFSIAVCVVMACMYMFPEGFPQSFTVADQCAIKGLQLLGVVAAYLGVHLLAKQFMAYAFKPAVLAAVSALFAFFPIVILLDEVGITPTFPAYCICALATGFAGGYLTLCWLDICSRLRVRRLTTFTAGAFAAAGVLNLFIVLVPSQVQPAFTITLVVLNFAMVCFAGLRTQKAPSDVVPRSEYLTLTREIEPAFFIIGIAFGIALSYLYCMGGFCINLCIASITCGGAVALVAASLAGSKIDDVTILLRTATAVIFVAFLIAPFAPGPVRIACFCAVAATWSFFTSLNYSLLVKRNKSRNLFVFWNISACMAVKPLGVMVGWLVGGMVMFPAGDTLGISISLLVVAALGVDEMVFLPVTRHHDDWTDGRVVAEVPQVTAHNRADTEAQEDLASAVGNGPAAEQLLQRRCTAVSDLYQLSPRESELLLYLARGRNAAYIQRQLTISPNTIKTHIYKIYRKLGIHSQQQLMDLIEDFAMVPPEGQTVQAAPSKFVPPGRPLR